MNTLAAVNAERIKLTTTRSTLWIAVAVAVLSLALALLQGALAHASAPLGPQQSVLGVAVFGVPVLMVLASMTVTAEYRSGMVRTTFTATPNRTLVVLAKVIVAALFSAAYAAVLVVTSVLVGQVSAHAATAGVSLEVGRLAGAIALYAALAATLGVAVGALLRAGPGAVAVLLLWPLVVEPMLGNLPDVGPRLGPYLPFANIFLVIDVPWLYPVYAMPWGATGSLMYFVAWVAMVLGAAIALVNLRDA